MPTNEEGEFELVLGNRQLLSVFFIVVVLLGVFFTMGYILGRNTGPKTEMAAARPARPVDVPATQPPSPAVDLSKPPAATEPPKPEPKPEPEPKKPEPVKPEPAPVKQEPAKPEPKPEPKPEVRKAEPSKGGKGTYLQVSATSKKDGETLVGKLAGKGFSAMTSPVPNSELVRVLVGPVDDVADTRARLKAAGFQDPIVRKM